MSDTTHRRKDPEYNITIHTFRPNNGHGFERCPNCGSKIWVGYNKNAHKQPIRRYDCTQCWGGTLVVHYISETKVNNGNNT